MLHKKQKKAKPTRSNISGLFAVCLAHVLLGCGAVEITNWFMYSVRQDFDAFEFQWPVSIMLVLLGMSF